MENPRLILTAACMALRSYQYGNASEDLARQTADAIEKWLGNHDTVSMLTSMVEEAGGTVDKDSLDVLPDGTGNFTASFPLPKDHWLYEPNGEPPMPWRVGVGDQRTGMAKRITEATKYAYRASTMNGTEEDIDPDALVQNMIVGMLGYWTEDGFSHADDVLKDEDGELKDEDNPFN